MSDVQSMPGGSATETEPAHGIAASEQCVAGALAPVKKKAKGKTVNKKPKVAKARTSKRPSKMEEAPTVVLEDEDIAFLDGMNLQANATETLPDEEQKRVAVDSFSHATGHAQLPSGMTIGCGDQQPQQCAETESARL